MTHHKGQRKLLAHAPLHDQIEAIERALDEQSAPKGHAPRFGRPQGDGKPMTEVVDETPGLISSMPAVRMH
ncbi:MAG TPA: hypothetical protein VFE63_14650 [Roseiarcus sp.]|jgi:hypothetical protein|nr:hypothetical protein [Roseiarcus sp.]